MVSICTLWVGVVFSAHNGVCHSILKNKTNILGVEGNSTDLTGFMMDFPLFATA